MHLVRQPTCQDAQRDSNVQLDIVPVVPFIPLVLRIYQGELDGNNSHTNNEKIERRQRRCGDLLTEILEPVKDPVELDRRDLAHNMLKLFGKGLLNQL